SAMAVGAKGTALRGTDPDGRWTAMTTATHADLHGVAFDRGDAYAVGAQGVVLRLPAGSANWFMEPIPTHADLLSVWANGDGLVIAVGRGGAVVRRTAEGAWVLEPS